VNRLRVVVLFGGKSVEREVSIISARTIAQSLDPEKYEVIPIAIGPEGRFLAATPSAKLLTDWQAPQKFLGGDETRVSHSRSIIPAEIGRGKADVVFPIIHGATGEDGSIQGMLEVMGVPYVGAGVTGSAVGMDKVVFKALMRDAKIPIARAVALAGRDREAKTGPSLKYKIGLPLPIFVKPANGGSSVGVTKVKEWKELQAAVDLAFRYDDRVLVEEAIDARELECAVLGNDEPAASVVGEIVPGREFYDYDDKYRDDKAKLLIPAPVTKAISEEARRLAVEVFRVSGISGMARVDFFLKRGTDRLFVNELNTLPGFTAISMYPKLWEASGLPLPKLLDELIRLALERKSKRDQLSHEPPGALG